MSGCFLVGGLSSSGVCIGRLGFAPVLFVEIGEALSCRSRGDLIRTQKVIKRNQQNDE